MPRRRIGNFGIKFVVKDGKKHSTKLFNYEINARTDIREYQTECHHSLVTFVRHIKNISVTSFGKYLKKQSLPVYRKNN